MVIPSVWKERCRKPRRSHQGHGKENVGQVRNRGIGQPLFKVTAFERHAGAVQHGNKGQRHDQPLTPCAAEDFCAKGIVGQANAGEGTGLDNGHRMQQSRDRRGSHRRLGQPCMQGDISTMAVAVFVREAN